MAMKAMVVAAALIGAAWGAQAQAVTAPDVISKYSFTGTCFDCYGGNGNGLGTLTLRNYAGGTAAELSTANFVEFTYTSDLMPNVDVTAVDNLSGSLSSLPGSNTVTFQSADLSFTFQSFSGGFWCLGPNGCAADFGFSHSWAQATTGSNVPEPAAWALMLAGFALTGMALRAQRRTTVRFA